MEVIVASAFSALIIFITVFSIIKVLLIAFRRNEISLRKSIMYAIISVVIGLLVVTVLPFG
ncbi:hypothetical protein R4Z09_13970 [Niallia oryzisoli]|uniref:Uncharacterized protein n=1 Tax=Niallia oryzisoli TaxID=1737571 RepID=A0ABZ2CN00_9BACI